LVSPPQATTAALRTSLIALVSAVAAHHVAPPSGAL